MHSFAPIALVLLFGTTMGLPTKDEEKAVTCNNFKLTGASGEFSYRIAGGNYKHDEQVLVLANLPPRTVFTVEESSTCSYYKLTISKWEGRNFVLNGTFCGMSTVPKHNLPTGDVLLAFSSDGTITRTGFSVSLTPIQIKAKYIFASSK